MTEAASLPAYLLLHRLWCTMTLRHLLFLAHMIAQCHWSIAARSIFPGRLDARPLAWITTTTHHDLHHSGRQYTSVSTFYYGGDRDYEAHGAPPLMKTTASTLCQTDTTHRQRSRSMQYCILAIADLCNRAFWSRGLKTARSARSIWTLCNIRASSAGPRFMPAA